MATYRIYFFGLVMHIELEGKGHSAVVHDPDHDARLLFDEHDEVDLTGIHSVGIVAADLPERPAKREGSFGDYVPSAEQILGGSLETSPGRGTGSKATYVHHVGGSLYAADLYPLQAQYFRDQNEVRPKKCVAMFTLLLLESAKPVTIKAGAVSRRLAADSCILFANFDRDDQHDPKTKPHVRKYSRLTNSSNTDITILEDPDTDCTGLIVPVEPCDWILRVIKDRGVVTAAHPECGNSAWP